jgi:signal peptidase II
MIFLLAGGASNAYDRVKRGYVVDYFIINKGWLKRTIFNLADMFLFLGGVICAVTGKKRGEL